MKTSTTGIRVRGLIAAGILGTLACGYAAAGPSSGCCDTASTVIRYGDLNVARPEEAATLYSRIVAAAHDICDVYVDVSAKAMRQAKTCVHNAVADAVTKARLPQLVAIYNARNREPLPVAVASARRP